MPKKKVVAKKASKKKVAPKKAAASKASPKAAARTTVATSKAAPKAAVKARKPARAKSKEKKVRVRIVGTPSPVGTIGFPRRGLGADAGGQSGDTEGLPETAKADSESVEELTEEGQAFEAEAIDGVEEAPDADEGEVKTHEVPEDDVPEEYDDDQD